MKLNPLRIGIASILLFGCNKEEKFKGYSEKGKELFYAIRTIGEGDKRPAPGNYLWLSAVYKTLSDSVFWDDTHNAPYGYFYEFRSLKNGNLTSYFPEMQEGDSVSFIMKTSLFFRETFDVAVPAFCQKDSFIKAELKLKRILLPTELKEAKQHCLTILKSNAATEAKRIAIYAGNNFKNPEQFANGVWCDFIKRNQDSAVSRGKLISIRYTANFLEGRLADFTPQGKNFDMVYGQQDQVISGLQFAVSKMKKGEKAKFILPSQLAFGEQGNSSGSIPPYCPLVYEVEIIDVK